MLCNIYAPLRPFSLAVAICRMVYMDSGVVGAVANLSVGWSGLLCGVVARAQL